MAWNISATAIRNPAPPIMLFLALITAGLMAFFSLPVNQMPNVEFPSFTVTTVRPGAAPAELEGQVAQKIESALSNIDGVKRITTSIQPGVAVSTVELWDDVDLMKAVDDARNAVSSVRADLPDDVEEPLIQRIDFAAFPLGYFALEAPNMSAAEAAWYIDNELTRELLTVPGVGKVARYGGASREIRVELDPDKMRVFGVTAETVNNQLLQVNVNAPGGRSVVGGAAQSVRTLGEVKTVEELAATSITLPGGRTVRLSDIATVRDGSEDPTAIGRWEGKQVLSYGVSRSKGASAVKVFDDVEKRLKEIGKKRPDIKLITMASTVDTTRQMYESSLMSILEGAILAVIVVFAVLRDWRATLISAFAIPLSIIPTFFVMQLFGFTLNFLTLIALGLVVGVLVDDAIVEVENIVRHMRMGKRPYQAALEAADEIGLAVVATSCAILAVFVPVAFMPGVTGQIFKSFGLTVAVAVFFSLLVARLITPMMAAFFLKASDHEEKPSKLRAKYMKALDIAIRKPWMTAGVGLAIFIVSILLATRVPAVFSPRTDQDFVQSEIEFSPGTTLEEGDVITTRLTDQLRKKPYIADIFQVVDGSSGSADKGTMFIHLKDRSERTLSSYDVQQEIRPILNAIPNVRGGFIQDSGPATGADITLDFVGSNPEAVAQAADQLVKEIKPIPELGDVKSSASLKRPELQIRPKLDVAARLGVSAASIAQAVRVATGGEVDQRSAKFSLGDRQVPIRVMLAPWARQDLETIRAMPVSTQNGTTLRLDAVADISFGLGEATLQRRDKERKVTVSANVISGEVGDAKKKVMAAPALKSLPPGVRMLQAGSSEEESNMFSSFAMAMVTGIFLIYAVLVLLFRDFFQPVTIMMALPLSLAGAVLGLIVFMQPMSIFVLIGILMLMGIVSKNSILLVDFAVEQMHAGKNRQEALMEAGAKRVRPIVMTTIAMSAGMVPLVLGLGPDGAMRQGMAAVVIGGLIVSTVLSLLFIPAVFILIARLENWMVPFFGRMSTYDGKLDAEPGRQKSGHQDGHGAPLDDHGFHGDERRPAAE